MPKEQSEIFWEMDDLVLKTKKTSVNIETTTNAAGSRRWVESTKSYCENAKGEPFIIGVLSDITELKTREEALIIAEQKAREAAKIKTQILANISHEIRTPMNGVMGMTSVLQSTDLTTEQEDMVSVIERSADSLLAIINDILDSSKMETGKFKIDQAPFLLSDIVDDIAALLGVTANAKGIELVIDIDDETPKVLLGDAGRLRQVLINLIGNGIKFTETGYVVLKVKTQIDDAAKRKRIHFFIRDTGMGIEKDQLENIFNKFEQVDGSTTRKVGGTGLGLSISRNLINLMGGDISVKSNVNSGSVFFFTLDLPYDENAPIEKAKTPDTFIDFKGRRALIVDDLDVNLSVLKSNLERHSMVVDQAKSAVEATALLKAAIANKTRYDVIITDFLMPKIDGLSLVKAIKNSAYFKSTPLMVLSSVDTVDSQSSFQKYDIDKYLIKPVKTAKLLQEIANILPKAASQTGRRLETETASKTNVTSKEGCAGRILLAEDNAINRQVFQMALVPEGYDLDSVENGKLAFDHFQREKYDVILMDVSMPVMDGLEATKAIRDYEAVHKLTPTPILALTAHSSAEDSVRFMKTGMDEVLSKPLKAGDLIEKVKSMMPEKTKN